MTQHTRRTPRPASEALGLIRALAPQAHAAFAGSFAPPPISAATPRPAPPARPPAHSTSSTLSPPAPHAYGGVPRRGI